MTDREETTRLVQLLEEALAEADRQGNTLLAALIANCVEASRRGTAGRPFAG